MTFDEMQKIITDLQLPPGEMVKLQGTRKLRRLIVDLVIENRDLKLKAKTKEEPDFVIPLEKKRPRPNNPRQSVGLFDKHTKELTKKFVSIANAAVSMKLTEDKVRTRLGRGHCEEYFWKRIPLQKVCCTCGELKQANKEFRQRTTYPRQYYPYCNDCKEKAEQ